MCILYPGQLRGCVCPACEECVCGCSGFLWTHDRWESHCEVRGACKDTTHLKIQMKRCFLKLKEVTHWKQIKQTNRCKLPDINYHSWLLAVNKLGCHQFGCQLIKRRHNEDAPCTVRVKFNPGGFTNERGNYLATYDAIICGTQRLLWGRCLGSVNEG